MDSNRLLIIDGNSIMNRAFYGIMSSKSLMSADGKYTNAIYGFLSILFKDLEDLKPDYIAVAFDLKAPTHRHKMYKEYKGTRHAMPQELAEQMPVIKEVLKAMNIAIIEKEGYEADDVIGTISKQASDAGHYVTILSGDRDNFQLASDKVTIRIPRTKMGKTETEDYDDSKIIEEYGVKPVQLIQVKGLMGDTSDNIPGVPGVGEKTALKLIKEYENIDNLYEKLEAGQADDIKGALKTKLENNKDLAMLSRTLGTILRDAPLGVNIEDLRTKEWDKEAVTNKFKELQFNRFIERFDLNGLGTPKKEAKIEDLFTLVELDKNTLKDELSKINDKFIYYIEKEKIEDESAIIKETFKSLYFYKDKKVFYVKDFEITPEIINIFADEKIDKISYRTKPDYIIFKEHDCEYNNIKYDAEIAGYNLNPTDKNNIEEMSKKYLELDMDEYLENEFNGNRKKSRDIEIRESRAAEELRNYYRELDTAIAAAGGITDQAQSRKRSSNAEFRESERVHADTEKADTDAGRRETDDLVRQAEIARRSSEINRRNSVSDNRIVRNAEAESIASAEQRRSEEQKWINEQERAGAARRRNKRYSGPEL